MVEEDTLDISWIQEEEALMDMVSIPNKTPLQRVELQFLFVDSESYVKRIPKRMVELDVLGTSSILSKESLEQCIETAKKEYTNTFASSGVFSIMDILIWNITLGAEHIQPFVDTGMNLAFLYGKSAGDFCSVNSIVLEPSLSIFHSIQSIIIVFRESKQCIVKKPVCKKHTKRVRFHPNAYNTTRKTFDT